MKRRISRKRLKTLLHYDPETGELTRLKNATRSDLVGQAAGTITTHGYVSVCVDGQAYQAHVLIWYYVTGRWPPRFLDHENTVRHNNRWTNLRLATRQQNNANSVVSKNNLLRVKGVRRISKNRFNARLGQKSLGCFSTVAAASAAYESAAERAYGAFARAK